MFKSFSLIALFRHFLSFLFFDNKWCFALFIKLLYTGVSDMLLGGGS